MSMFPTLFSLPKNVLLGYVQACRCRARKRIYKIAGLQSTGVTIKEMKEDAPF
jgi:hypothetical protein